AENRGWIAEPQSALELSGVDAVQRLKILAHRLGSIYNRGATTTISALDIEELALADGGTLTVRLEDVSPQSMKALGEFFEVLGMIMQRGSLRDGYIRIDDPDTECPLIRELQKD